MDKRLLFDALSNGNTFIGSPGIGCMTSMQILYLVTFDYGIAIEPLKNGTNQFDLKSVPKVLSPGLCFITSSIFAVET